MIKKLNWEKLHNVYIRVWPGPQETESKMQENHESKNLKSEFYCSNITLSHLKHSATNQATQTKLRTIKKKTTQHIQSYGSPTSSVIKQDVLIKIFYLYWVFLLITACKQSEANI
jgi:hypothetical protein